MGMQQEQLALAIIFGVLLGPVPFVVLFVYICCRKDVCHLRGRPQIYTSMKKLGANEEIGKDNTNPDQVFESPVAPPQIE